MPITRRSLRRIQVLLFIATLVFMFHFFVDPRSTNIVKSHLPAPLAEWQKNSKIPNEITEEKELVVASLAGDDIAWLDEHFSTWKQNIYVVNNASAPLTVPKNKGREAMPFLT